MGAALILVGGLLALSTQPAPIPPGDAAVAGRIIDRDSKRPLAGVLVQLSSADLRGQLIARTDADGTYVFEGIAAGPYRVTARLPNYIDQAYGVPDAQMGLVSPEAIVKVAVNSRAQIDFALVRMGTVMGRVIAEGGEPLNKASVTLTMITDRGIGVSRWRAQTDSRGQYSITSVPEGSYQASAMWTDQETTSPSTVRQRRQIFHPGTESPDQATTFTLAAGQRIENIDIVMPANELLRLTGKVVRSSSLGAVEAYLLGGASVQNVIVRPDGSFATPRLTTGRYTLVVRTIGAEMPEATWLTIDLTAELNDLVLGLQPTGVIAGRVVSDDGSPVPDTLQVTAVLADEGTEIDLLMRDRVDIAKDGAFAVRGVFGERVLRIVGRTEGWAIDRVLHGKTPVTSVKVDPSSEIDDVRIIVTRRP